MRAALAAAFAGLFLGTSFGQEGEARRFDKGPHSWFRHKPGTAVKYRIATALAGLKQEGEIFFTLDAVSATGYKVEVRLRMSGQEDAREEIENVSEKAGTETLTIAGKERVCTIWKSTGKRDHSPSEHRFWMAEGINVPVKVTSKIGDDEFEMTAEKLDEVVAAAGKKFTCAKLTGKMKDPNVTDSYITIWWTDEIPGGWAKMELGGKTQGQAFSTRFEVEEIKEGK